MMTVTLVIHERRARMDRIIGAFTFRRGVYAEVEGDTTFTTTAWIIVLVSAALNQLGAFSSAGFDNLLGWLGGAVVGGIFAIVAFAIAVFLVNWVGRTVFNADVSFDELVRTLGLAYVWQAVGVLGVLGAAGTALSCVVAPAQAAAAIAGLFAWFIAAKEALDLEWLQVIITVVIAWFVIILFTFIAGAVIGLLGLGVGAAAGILG